MFKPEYDFVSVLGMEQYLKYDSYITLKNNTIKCVNKYYSKDNTIQYFEAPVEGNQYLRYYIEEYTNYYDTEKHSFVINNFRSNYDEHLSKATPKESNYNTFIETTDASLNISKNGLTKINDSLLIIKSKSEEYYYPALDVSGNEIFDKEEDDYLFTKKVGRSISGVYNTLKREWIIPRKYSYIQKTYSGTLLEEEQFQVSYIEKYNYTSEEITSRSYSFVDNNGKSIFKDIQYDSLLKYDNPYQYIAPKYKVDSVTDFIEGYQKLWSEGKFKYLTTSTNTPYVDVYLHTREYWTNLYSIENDSIFFRKLSKGKKKIISFPIAKDILLKKSNEFNKTYFRNLSKYYLIQFDSIKETSKEDFEKNINTYEILLSHSNDNRLLCQEQSYKTYIFKDNGSQWYDNQGAPLNYLTDQYSGVYNNKKRQWIIPPNKQDIYKCNENYLIHKNPVLDFNNITYNNQTPIITSNETYIITDTNGEILEQKSELSQISKKYINALSPDDFEKLNK